MSNVVVEKVRSLITPAIAGAEYELVDVEWKRESGSWVLRVFIDHAAGVSPSVRGISHEDCERVSRELSALLDVHDVIPHEYNLEVSSPGLNRPLRTPDHFRRFAGQKAKVKLKQGIEGRRNYAGTIAGVEGNTVQIEVDGKLHTLP